MKKTRFGHHYAVLERLFRVKNGLISMVLNDEWEELKKGSSRSNLEHDQVKKVVLDDEFWGQVKFILSVTKPIWLMIHFCDFDKAVVGEVYQRMEDMIGSIEEVLQNNRDLYKTVENLILERWRKMNLPLHTLAYVLTPFYYSQTWLRKVGLCERKRIKPHANSFVQGMFNFVVNVT